MNKLTESTDSTGFDTIDTQLYLDGVSHNTGENIKIYYTGEIFSPEIVGKLQFHLKHFFMTPYDKWRVCRKVPWKLIIQAIKIILITAQVSVFASHNSRFVTFLSNYKTAMRNLILKDWKPNYEVEPHYDSFNLYSKRDVFKHIDYAIHKYYRTPKMSAGVFKFVYNANGTILPITFVYQHMSLLEIFDNGSFISNIKEVNDKCYLDISEDDIKNFSIKSFLTKNNLTIDFNVLVDIKVKFSLCLINMDTPSLLNLRCFKFQATITFDNSAHSGEIMVHLDSDTKPIRCKGLINYTYSQVVRKVGFLFLNILVIATCCVTSSLCVRSLHRGYRVHNVTVKFFDDFYKKQLSIGDRLEFLNFWYILMIVADILFISGSAFLISRSVGSVTSPTYKGIGILLGSGTLVLWLSVLYYLSFFRKYNLLILAVKQSMPNVIRFLLCAFVIYFGYLFCGWVVLGPYHKQFRSLSSTSEVFISIINGDDVFATFASLQSKKFDIWLYSRIYLYSFICVYTYLVVSLIIALVTDAYHTIKKYYQGDFPQSDLYTFINVCEDSTYVRLFKSEKPGEFWQKLHSMCFKKNNRIFLYYELTTP